MKKLINTFIWSDQYCIEDNDAWFVSGTESILFHIDLESDECEYVTKLPDFTGNDFRKNPRCIKCGNYILCLPDCSNIVWIYDLEEKRFEKIEIENGDNVRISITSSFIFENRLYLFSTGLKQLMEINLVDKKIADIYIIGEKEDGGRIPCNTIVDNSVFFVSSTENVIYQFDLVTKIEKQYILPEVEKGLCTICFDGKKFLMSGYQKKIYIWDYKSNAISVMSNFPNNFGIYDFDNKFEQLIDYEISKFETPTFLECIEMNNSIWFIPFKTNTILYIDKETYQLHAMEIEEEEESYQSLTQQSRLAAKYLVQYVRKGKYIGIYSLKRKCVFEIDVEAMTVSTRGFYISLDSIKEMSSLFLKKIEVLLESNCLHKYFFNLLLSNTTKEKSVGQEKNIGYEIYKYTNQYMEEKDV